MLPITTLINRKFILFQVPVEIMRSIEIGLAIVVILLVTVLSSGCTGNNADTGKITTPTPVPAAVDLQKKGFDAYIKGNYTEALDFYNQSVTADPKYARAWMDRGEVLVNLNRTYEAVSSYDSALALDNNSAIVWNDRGEVLMALGNYTAASESFDKALEIAPEYAIAKENRNLVLKKMSNGDV
jgi:tetratricopeptide (TPR) repeat protein